MVKMADQTRHDLGDIGVSNDVFESISSLCMKRIQGVAEMEVSEGLVESLTKVWGRSDVSRGVKVTPGEDDLTVEMTVVLEEGHSIPLVAGSVQKEVKNIIEEMTGHTVRAVNVLVADVRKENESAKIKQD